VYFAHPPGTSGVPPGAGLSEAATVRLHVQPLNDAPRITSAALTTIAEGELYAYDVAAVEPDAADPLHYALLVAPSMLSIGATNGQLRGLPANADVGVHLVTVEVTDLDGLSSLQSFSLTVTDVNAPPRFISLAPSPGPLPLGSTYSVRLTAVDEDPGQGELVRYALLTAPSGASIEPITGDFQYRPLVAHGLIPVTLRARDPLGAYSELQFALSADIDRRAPTVSVTITPRFVGVGQPVQIVVAAIDNAGPPVLAATVATPSGVVPLSLDPSRRVTFAPAEPGQHVVRVTATDLTGNQASAESAFSVPQPPDTQAPIVTLMSPTTGPAHSTTPPSVLVGGTVTDDTGLDSLSWSSSSGAHGGCAGMDVLECLVSLVPGSPCARSTRPATRAATTSKSLTHPPTRRRRWSRSPARRWVGAT
ncbi:MAG: hypothetical protein HYV07_28710, partial [Deltaproteobacteria bacterium]|nr:hypothetical protein [Deltaproteobacteria bacterium]